MQAKSVVLRRTSEREDLVQELAVWYLTAANQPAQVFGQQIFWTRKRIIVVRVDIAESLVLELDNRKGWDTRLRLHCRERVEYRR